MYNILWLDDEFVGNKKAFRFKESLERIISNDNPSVEITIEVCASYERFAQYLETKTPNVVILDVECYDKEDDIHRDICPSPSGFFRAKQLADSRKIPVIVFTGTRVCDDSSDFSCSIQNCAYAFEKSKGFIPLYEALFKGYDGKKAVLVGNKYPDYPFFDALLDHNILPINGVIKDQHTDAAISGILKEYEKLIKVNERNFQDEENNNIGNIRTIIEYIFNNFLKRDFAQAIPYGNYSRAFRFSNFNNFTLGLWYQHKNLGNETIPDEVKLALAYVWDGSCSFVHTNDGIHTPQIFKSLIDSLQVKRMVYDSFIIVMKWFAIYKINNMKPKEWNQLQFNNDIR